MSKWDKYLELPPEGQKLKEKVLEEGSKVKKNWDNYKEPAKPTDTTTSRSVEGFLRGIGQGASFGFIDEAEGGLGALQRAWKYLTSDKPTDKSLADAVRTGYITERDAARLYDKQLAQDAPVATTLGQVSAALPTVAVSAPLNIAKLATTQGALTGLGQSEGSGLNQLKDTAIGGVTGLALGKGAEIGIDKLKNILASSKNNLALKGLGANDAILNKISNPKDVANAAFEAGLIRPGTIGKASEKVQEALQDTGKKISSQREIGTIIPSEKILSELEKTRSRSLSNLDIPANTQLDNIKKNIQLLADTEGNISIPALADYTRELGNQSRKTFGVIGANKETIDDARRVLSGLENRELGKEFAQNKYKFSNLKKAEDIINKYKSSSNTLANTIGTTLGLGAGFGTGPAGGALALLLGTPEGRRQLMIMGAQGAKLGGQVLKPLDSEKLAKLSTLLGRFGAQQISGE